MERENEIVLGKTGLCIRDGWLLKQMSGGQVTARLALSDIRRAELVRVWDATGFVLVPATTALAVVAWLYIPWAGCRWTVAILFWALAGIFLSGIRDRALRLQTRHGCINYVIKDEVDDAQGFAMTLQDLIERHNSEIGTTDCAHDRQHEVK
ncbi:MAG: hypothetical protein NTU53_03725 [Planctomycetota bacterium]|nr:hypothetical protein [Planctomycetota bacterium]